MQGYRTLKFKNIYNKNDIIDAKHILNSSGINASMNKSNIVLNFDVVNLKVLKNIEYNPLIKKTIEELYKIRSFSSSNGKIVFKSFNKEKK